jgi:hypothetical protein
MAGFGIKRVRLILPDVGVEESLVMEPAFQ